MYHLNYLMCNIHGIIILTKIGFTQYRPGGTGPVGPAITEPTFELSRIFFNLKKNCEFFKIKSV